jgi:hypothetical protein
MVSPTTRDARDKQASKSNMPLQIIPHIAIVSGLLLAGNNPNILEGVFATERDAAPDEVRFLGLRFELVYPSCYKVAWQWLRGHTKKMWINKLLAEYGHRTDVDYTGNIELDKDMEDLRKETSLSPLDWFLILSLTLLLLGLPYALAFLTAYFTPQVGLSCRSLTFTVYICLEVAQIALWLWAYAGPPPKLPPTQSRRFRPLNIFRKGGWLDRSGFYSPTETDWLFGVGESRVSWSVFKKKEFWSLRTFWCGLYQFLQIVFGAGAIFSSLGGTLMQIMGVYRTNMCYVNTRHWMAPYSERPMVVLSVNSKQMIESALSK